MVKKQMLFAGKSIGKGGQQYIDIELSCFGRTEETWALQTAKKRGETHGNTHFPKETQAFAKRKLSIDGNRFKGHHELASDGM